MAGYFLLKYLVPYSSTTLVTFLLLCLFFPIYFDSHVPWTAARIRRYLAYISKVYLISTQVYILVCVPFAYILLSAQYSALNEELKGLRECAYRFQENDCTKNSVNSFYGKVTGVQRECFALAMCLRQPVWLLQIYAFLVELLKQIASPGSFHPFVIMTGSYVAWGLGSGRWMRGRELDAAVHVHGTDGVHMTGTTPPAIVKPGSGPKMATAVPEARPELIPAAAAPVAALEIQGVRLDAPPRSPPFDAPLFVNDGTGGPPRPRSPPLGRHPNPLQQNPVNSFSIRPVVGRPGGAHPGPGMPPQPELHFISGGANESPVRHHVTVPNNSPESGAQVGWEAEDDSGEEENPFGAEIVNIPASEWNQRGDNGTGVNILSHDSAGDEIDIGIPNDEEADEDRGMVAR